MYPDRLPDIAKRNKILALSIATVAVEIYEECSGTERNWVCCRKRKLELFTGGDGVLRGVYKIHRGRGAVRPIVRPMDAASMHGRDRERSQRSCGYRPLTVYVARFPKRCLRRCAVTKTSPKPISMPGSQPLLPLMSTKNDAPPIPAAEVAVTLKTIGSPMEARVLLAW